MAVAQYNSEYATSAVQ